MKSATTTTMKKESSLAPKEEVKRGRRGGDVGRQKMYQSWYSWSARPIDAWWRSEGLLTIETKLEQMFANPVVG
jgi:hypothetical protein